MLGAAQGWASVAAVAVGAVCAALGWILAPRVAELSVRDGRSQARRWWLRRPSQALVLGVLGSAVTLAPVALWPGLVLGLGAAGLACLVDAASHRLPDVLTVRTGGVALVLCAAGCLAAGWGAVLALVAGAAVAGGVLALLAVANPAGMGLGDVKLATLLGGLTGGLAGSLAAGAGGATAAAAVGQSGAIAPSAALAAGAGVSAVLLVGAFVLGGATSLLLLAARRVGRRDTLPFGPFLLLGALVAMAASLASAG